MFMNILLIRKFTGLSPLFSFFFGLIIMILWPILCMVILQHQYGHKGWFHNARLVAGRSKVLGENLLADGHFSP